MGKRSLYIGESHRTWWDRAGNHYGALKSREQNYAIVRHWFEDHSTMEEPPEYKFELKMRCRTSLQRQIMEAIFINSEPCDLILNGRGEWGINIIPRLAPTENGELVNPQIEPGPKRKTSPNTTDGKPQLLSEFDSQFSMRKKRAKIDKDKVIESRFQAGMSTDIQRDNHQISVRIDSSKRTGMTPNRS